VLGFFADVVSSLTEEDKVARELVLQRGCLAKDKIVCLQSLNHEKVHSITTSLRELIGQVYFNAYLC
jgi:hypothetical protein